MERKIESETLSRRDRVGSIPTVDQIAADHQRPHDSINRGLREAGPLVNLLDPQSIRRLTQKLQYLHRLQQYGNDVLPIQLRLQTSRSLRPALVHAILAVRNTDTYCCRHCVLPATTNQPSTDLNKAKLQQPRQFFELSCNMSYANGTVMRWAV